MKFLKYSTIVICSILLILYIWGKLYSIEAPLVKSSRIADTIHIQNDLRFLTKECRYRNYQNLAALNKAADYVEAGFKKITPRVEEQRYRVKGQQFRNITCSVGPENAERIIIGAHYDACGDQEGADDNASGIAGLLELARLLNNADLRYRVDFVAYTLEEPPFFRSNYMGSYMHAKYLHDQHIPVKGMICLEMVGYYSSAENSQDYPVGIMEWFYGDKADYITAVHKWNNGSFADTLTRILKTEQYLPTKSFTGPAWVPGVDFSDHLNYWKFGYSALMLTNTSFYRNHNYHLAGDTFETINMGNIGLVVDELYRAIRLLQ
ncbi:MAG TPA: M28 family peptidase [Panacibacter sp.]|nr:M28 family peptidase [Panacibacter sp.]HNP46162.1 M28 family peptidase [Panacibacter sp.]